MKKMTLLMPIILLSSNVVLAAPLLKFSGGDLSIFEKTNKCEACDLSGARLGSNHSNALLNNTNLSSVNAEGVNFSGSKMQNANCSGGNFYHANFSQADLKGAQFAGANLEGANLFGAIGADLKNANVCRAIMPDGSKGHC